MGTVRNSARGTGGFDAQGHSTQVFEFDGLPVLATNGEAVGHHTVR